MPAIPVRGVRPVCDRGRRGTDAVAQARRRLLRHPGPGARGGQAARGRGPPDHQAQHRQPGPVRLRRTGRDPASTSSATCPTPQGYSDSQGLLSARTAVVQHYQSRGIDITDVDDIWLGNGVSELIAMALQAMLDNGDEVLVPAPDYPLWTASTVARRRPAGALPVRRGERLAARPRRPRGRRSPTAPRRSSSSTRTTRPARSTPRGAARRSPTSPASTAWSSSPTRSTTRSSTTTPCTPRSPRSRRTCSR